MDQKLRGVGQHDADWVKVGWGVRLEWGWMRQEAGVCVCV